MLRGTIGAVCCASLLVASACVSGTSDGRDPHPNGEDRDSEFKVEAATQAELPRAPDRTAPADGWRWESSLGIELAVPADWSVNDVGCGQTDAPTIVRGPGSGLDCFTPEPLTKQIVRIGLETTDPRLLGKPGDENSPPEGLTPRDVSIDGMPAQRAQGQTSGGRASGWLHIPSLGVIVTARVLEEETLQRIFDSVRMIRVDHNGCATSRADMRPTPPAAETFMPAEPTALSICFVGQRDILESSALIEGPAAMELVELLNHAKRGMNADVPENRCKHTDDVPPADLMLIAQADSDRALVQVSFSGCTYRGMTNGRSTAQLTETLLHAMMEPLDRGYGYQPFPK